MNARQKVLNTLEDMNIPYQMTEHPAVYTIEEMNQLGVGLEGDVVKNLFLRDAKGRRHFLVVLSKEKSADLKKLKELLGSTTLGFASEERLMKYLGLTKGSVTPLGVLNDSQGQVEVVLDNDLVGNPRLGVHPNDNTATVWISYESLISVIAHNGNPLRHVQL